MASCSGQPAICTSSIALYSSIPPSHTNPGRPAATAAPAAVMLLPRPLELRRAVLCSAVLCRNSAYAAAAAVRTNAHCYGHANQTAAAAAVPVADLAVCADGAERLLAVCLLLCGVPQFTVNLALLLMPNEASAGSNDLVPLLLLLLMAF